MSDMSDTFIYYIEKFMKETLEKHEGSVKFGGKSFTNRRFTDDIDGLVSSQLELVCLLSKLDNIVKPYGIEINEIKMYIMTNSEGHFNSEIKINDKQLQIFDKFKYLGSIID